MACPRVSLSWTPLGILAVAFAATAVASDNVLNIPPVMQISATSCWLATGEMVFRYYHIPANAPNYQCGELRFQGAHQVAPFGPMAFTGPCWANCGPCSGVAAGSIQGIVNMIVQYPQGMSIVTGQNVALQNPSVSLTPLEASDVVAEIDFGRPIIAGISPGAGMLPPGLSEHAVLIVGYRTDGSVLLVNDPFPYQSVGMTPPYLSVGGVQVMPGRFAVSYTAMRDSLNWGNAVYGIQP